MRAFFPKTKNRQADSSAVCSRAKHHFVQFHDTWYQPCHAFDAGGARRTPSGISQRMLCTCLSRCLHKSASPLVPRYLSAACTRATHLFIEADVGWYQPCRVLQDSTVPPEAQCFVQPFHPGVMNILFPYDDTLTKMRAAQQRSLAGQRPLHGRYDRSDAASSSHAAPPLKSPRTGQQK